MVVHGRKAADGIGKVYLGKRHTAGNILSNGIIFIIVWGEACNDILYDKDETEKWKEWNDLENNKISILK